MAQKNSSKFPKSSTVRTQPKTAGKAPASPFRAAAPKPAAARTAPGQPAQPTPKSAKNQSRPAAPPQAPAPLPTIPTARITRRASDSIRRGHLWVYSSDIEAIHASKENSPALLAVTDNRGIPLGTALYSPSSQITLRLVSRDLISEAQWHQLLADRLREAIARRAPLLNEDNNAARLVFSEADNLPGIVLDKYADVVILQLLAKGLDNEAARRICVETISAAVNKNFPSESLTLWERPDPRIRQLEGLSAPASTPLYHRGAHEPQASAIFRINGLRFHFDAQAGQKTGAFLDQRQNYAAAARWAKNRSVRKALDICTYQGGFALHLAHAGCHVTAVDQSRSSLEVAEQNLSTNREAGHLPANTEIEWLEADAFELLRDWATQVRAKSTADALESSQEPWQLIVLDPPAFAKSKRAVEGAMRGYKELNLRALQLLAPGGLLVTCSCSHHVSLADLESAVASAAVDSGRRVTLLERRGAALDHPTILNLPETEYLKCLIFAVD